MGKHNIESKHTHENKEKEIKIQDKSKDKGEYTKHSKDNKDNKDENSKKTKSHEFTQKEKNTYRKKKEERKVTTQDILTQNAFKATRDAEWFKRTINKIEQVKKELDDKFVSEKKREEKIDFIRILKTKIKDYKDAQKNKDIYKKVRFVERRKLERQLVKVNKSIAELELDKEKNKEKIEQQLKEKEEIIENINYVKVRKLIFLYYFLFYINFYIL